MTKSPTLKQSILKLVTGEDRVPTVAKRDILALSKRFELALRRSGISLATSLQTYVAISARPVDGKNPLWSTTVVHALRGAAMRTNGSDEIVVAPFDPPYAGEAHVVQGAPMIRKMTPQRIELTWMDRFVNRIFPQQFSAPFYLAVFVDSEFYDRRNFEVAIDEVERRRIFIHFFGMGPDTDVEYMTMMARYYPNVSFDHVEDPEAITAESLYAMMCNPKFSGWSKANARAVAP